MLCKDDRAIIAHVLDDLLFIRQHLIEFFIKLIFDRLTFNLNMVILSQTLALNIIVLTTRFKLKSNLHIKHVVFYHFYNIKRTKYNLEYIFSCMINKDISTYSIIHFNDLHQYFVHLVLSSLQQRNELIIMTSI